MTDQELINKAIIVMKYFKFHYEGAEVTIIRDFPEMLIENYPEIADQFSVHFSYDFKNKRPTLISVKGNKHTFKLIEVITRSNMYEVPDDLK